MTNDAKLGLLAGVAAVVAVAVLNRPETQVGLEQGTEANIERVAIGPADQVPRIPPAAVRVPQPSADAGYLTSFRKPVDADN